jgi:hypothetical protein
MAVGQGYSKTATNGLVFAFDTGDTRNSFLGRPTTNLMEGYGLSNYNNVPGSVTTTLSQTSDSYRGTPIWIQTLTPLDGSGVSWLSNGNNPGLGVVTSGGGGLANRYTGHSIFYKPTVPMHSVPIFLAYSNIGGWQCNTCPPEDMGDGWFRAKVLWYDTTTRSDGKYWAINPLSATLNTPITIYWAGPFKEDLNSQYISQYTPTSRSNTQSLLALAGGNSMSVADVSFNSNLQMTFDGTNDYINIPSSNVFDTQTVTVEVVVKPYATSQNGFWFEKGAVNTQYSLFMEGGNIVWRTAFGGTYDSLYFGSGNMTANAWNYVVGTYTAGDKRVYLNTTLMNSNSLNVTLNTNQGNQYIGSYNSNGYFYNGEIAVVKVYNRVLTPGEIKQNYGHYKTRFNLP